MIKKYINPNEIKRILYNGYCLFRDGFISKEMFFEMIKRLINQDVPVSKIYNEELRKK